MQNFTADVLNCKITIHSHFDMTTSAAYSIPGLILKPFEETLKERVERHFMPFNELKLTSRKREKVYIRQVCAYLLKRNTKMTLYSIAHYLNMDHATVVYSCRQVAQALEGYNNELKSYYEILKP